MPTVHRMDYGILEVGTPIHVGVSSCRRKDKYTNDSGKSFFEWSFCEAEDDGPRCLG